MRQVVSIDAQLPLTLLRRKARTQGDQSAGTRHLILGATGKVGSRIVRQLAAAGMKPRALVRSRDKGDAIASLATPVLGDLTVPETLEPAFRRAERVFILPPPVPEMEALERNAIDAAVAAGAKRIVYLSNFAATEGDEDRFVHIHGLHQRLVAKLGVDWTVLRPTRFMTSVPFVWSSHRKLPAVHRHYVLLAILPLVCHYWSRP